MSIRVTVWNEYRHELSDAKVVEVYPKGIHEAIAECLGEEADFTVTTATLDMPECGLPDEVLNNTDVLFWWGHKAHGEVPDELVERILAGEVPDGKTQAAALKVFAMLKKEGKIK